MGDDAPDDEGVLFRDANLGVLVVVRDEPCTVVGRVGAKLLDSKLPIDIRCHIIAVGGQQAAVDDHEVTEARRSRRKRVFGTGTRKKNRLRGS